VGEEHDPDPPALEQGTGRDLTCQPHPGARPRRPAGQPGGIGLMADDGQASAAENPAPMQEPLLSRRSYAVPAARRSQTLRVTASAGFQSGFKTSGHAAERDLGIRDYGASKTHRTGPAAAAIAAWAATIRLPGAEAAAIFQRIVGPPPARPATPRLDPSLWRHFTADFTARMVASTRPVRHAA
jgi:hypothetical protein